VALTEPEVVFTSFFIRYLLNKYTACLDEPEIIAKGLRKDMINNYSYRKTSQTHKRRVSNKRRWGPIWWLVVIRVCQR